VNDAWEKFVKAAALLCVATAFALVWMLMFALWLWIGGLR
jgi:hypothetical protein